MNMQAFEGGSGFSVFFVNHFILTVVGTLVCLTGAVLIAMLIHRLESGENVTHVWIVFYILCVISIILLFLGFLNNFWQ